MELFRSWRRRRARRRENDALAHTVTYRADGTYRPEGVFHCTASRWLAIAAANGGDYGIIGKICEPDGTPIPAYAPKPVLLKTLRHRAAAGARVQVELGPAEMGTLVDLAHDVGDEQLLDALRGAVARNAFPLHINLDEPPPNPPAPEAGPESG
ncbi:hypothetical protein ACFXPX_04670 [Kitasatospora sp. NPDC059146]|uniref:hypothetical protein n=1 Tax=unclassified Kitasatospora TaxID=2633591 RepID=UPI0036996614